MFRLLRALCCITPTWALAQMNIQVNGETDTSHAPYALETNNCNANPRVTWALPTGACQNSATVYATTSGSCGTTMGPNDVQLAINSDNASANIAISNLPTFQTSDAGTLSCPQPINQQNRICGIYKTGVDCGTPNAGGFASIFFKGKLPVAPSIDDVTPLDTEINVSASTTEPDVVAIHVEVAVADGGEFEERASFTPSVGSAKIGGLINTVTYLVRARSEDLVPQVGDYSDAVAVTPVHTSGFWDQYLQAGGAEKGGCGGIGAMIFAWCLPGVVLVALVRRRRPCRHTDDS